MSILVSIFMHYEHLNKDLVSIHVWRQTQTQSTINNFFEEDMNIFRPTRNDRGNTDGLFRMEFPLMQWSVAALYKVFGQKIIITRVFMLIIGFLSIIGMYHLLYALFYNMTLATIGAWGFSFSPSFYYYTINPLPDNMALCFAIWGTALFFYWYQNQKSSYLIFSGLLFSLAALCKLPFIIYFSIPAGYIMIKWNIKDLKKLTSIALRAFLFVPLPVLWYLTVIPQWHGNVIVSGFFGHSTSLTQLLDYYQHNLISTMPELLLNYGSLLFFLAGFYFLWKRRAYKNPKFILVLTLSLAALTYYFYEAVAIEKVHDYYLFPFYPLLFILVGYGAFHLFHSTAKNYRYFYIFLLLILPVTCYLRMHERWDTESPGFNPDLFAYKQELRDSVPKDALVVAGNDHSRFIFFYYIDKKGWGYQDDQLTGKQLQKMIQEGATYLYSDSRLIDENVEIKPLIEELILERGSIRIFKLKTSL
ncbi:glycosyltransferase family 39 protein [bacterium SCSIO 12643]|nr:glycosyltransferase family 39 protein [bacterium SCSIO 12643]